MEILIGLDPTLWTLYCLRIWPCLPIKSDMFDRVVFKLCCQILINCSIIFDKYYFMYLLDDAYLLHTVSQIFI